MPFCATDPLPCAPWHLLASGSVSATGSRGSVTGLVGGSATLAFTRSGLGGAVLAHDFDELWTSART
jgi:hypothetical protein